MKPISFFLSALTITIAVFGVFTAKAKEKKRTTSHIAYFINSIGVIQLTADVQVFENISITTPGAIRLNNGTLALLYENSDLTGTIKVKH